jgi:penicillin-binding protein 2
VLGLRLWDVQVESGTAYASQARAEQTETVITPSVRGEVTDDTGQPMVDNQTELVVSVNMAKVNQQPASGVPELRRLAKLLGMSYQKLSLKLRICTAAVHQPCWSGSPYQPIPVAQNASDKVVLQLLENASAFPGVTAGQQPVTNYVQPLSTDTAQVLGYLQPATAQEVKQEGLPESGFSGEDLVGQSGLEAEYDKYLRGSPGEKIERVNAAGQVTGSLGEKPAKSGDTLVTSINGALQEDVEKILANAIHKVQDEGNPQATSGAAVVLTTTGRVVAMANYPTYNPNVWTQGITEKEFKRLFGTADAEPILNRATQGEYSPGSTWKVTTTAAAVANGYSLYGLYNCPASVHIGTQNFSDDGEPNLGEMTLHQALVVSCDTVFYDLGYGMWSKDTRGNNVVTSPHDPVQTMQKMELDWGFGKYTGVDLPEQSTGIVPTREWLYYYWKQYKNYWCKHGRANGSYVQQIEYQDCQSGNYWSPGQAAISAIGQGYVDVTPLQLARAYAALANGGTLYEPRIGEALIGPSGKVVKRIRPKVAGHLHVASNTLAYIRSALQGVVTSGTAAGAFGGFPLNQVCVAGKTGTAQAYGRQATSVFASFAPCSHPKYVALVMIPDSGYGADVSAPAVKQIWDALYGLQGDKAAIPGGNLPSLPRVNSSGQIVATGAASGSPAQAVTASAESVPAAPAAELLAADRPAESALTLGTGRATPRADRHGDPRQADPRLAGPGGSPAGLSYAGALPAGRASARASPATLAYARGTRGRTMT